MTPTVKGRSKLFNVTLVVILTLLVVVLFALLGALGLMGKAGRLYVSMILALVGIAIWAREAIGRKK